MIVKKNITQQVADYIKSNIENGYWKPNERIPSENELTKLLGVSRSSIRFALQQFIALGILESVQGKGTFVKGQPLEELADNLKSVMDFNYENVRKVLQFRSILEVETCSIAAKNATEENLKQMRYCYEQMETNINNRHLFIKYDILFHMEIAKASQNDLIEKCMYIIMDQVELQQENLNMVFGSTDAMHYHGLILEAFEKRDGSQARRLMREHLRAALKEFE
jgi:GntR family transcriptional regulator, transcriptional repressor for pyruvate dehydrogenase complex